MWGLLGSSRRRIFSDCSRKMSRLVRISSLSNGRDRRIASSDRHSVTMRIIAARKASKRTRACRLRVIIVGALPRAWPMPLSALRRGPRPAGTVACPLRSSVVKNPRLGSNGPGTPVATLPNVLAHPLPPGVSGAADQLAMLALDGDSDAWDEFVTQAGGGTFCHLAGWREILSDVLGAECRYWAVADRGGAWQGVLPLVRVRR